jgi:DNA repair exonuclease SbcCD ATPase subunit
VSSSSLSLTELLSFNSLLQSNEQKFKMEISQLSSLNNKQRQEISDYELIHQELHQRIEAEVETSQISKALTQEALRSKESYEKQIDVLKHSYDAALKRYEELEEQCNELNSQNLTLQSELSAAREELSEQEVLLKESEEYKVVAAEVHQLRSQLIEIRKKIIYNNYTEEMNSASQGDRGGGEGAMRSTLERERGNRRVYESIIEDLRSQLEKVTASYDDAQRKMSEMRTRVMKLEELQDELDLYKETAKKVALENHKSVPAPPSLSSPFLPHELQRGLEHQRCS